MDYTDRIFGTFSIDEPVIEELILSKPLQRLKEVNQYGASFYRFPHLSTTRFEHSVGVYYVLRRLGASVTEQIVGLLHDAPHTAFSHVTDTVFGDASQTFHEKFHEKIIFESEIPRIMKKHGLSVWDLLNKKKFRLAERDIPDLCADRIDYFFRDCVTDKQLDLLDARKMMDDMTVVKGEIAFQTQALAEQYTIIYREANEKLWASPLQHALYYLLSSAMKLSLEEGVLTFEELFTTDQEVHAKMRASGNPQILKYLHDMEHVEVKEDTKDYDYHIVPKVRIVDPWVVQLDGSLKRVSEVNAVIQKDNEAYAEKLKRGYFVKVLS